jgi:hypothetical protein
MTGCVALSEAVEKGVDVVRSSQKAVAFPGETRLPNNHSSLSTIGHSRDFYDYGKQGTLPVNVDSFVAVR